MSCSPFDLRDYVLNELADSESRLVETHLKSCQGCREELERLHITAAALRSLPEEEIPARIGFVSDPVFEPSALRRFWRAWWDSPARLGFAAAAMLSCAILVSALTRPAPAPVPQAQRVDVAAIEARFNQQLETAVRKAVEQTEAADGQKMVKLLSAAEARHYLQLQEIRLAVDENLSRMEQRYQRVIYMAASNGEVR